MTHHTRWHNKSYRYPERAFLKEQLSPACWAGEGRCREPSPAGGADFVTNYTYNADNQLLTVSMPRGSSTQTRGFVWTGSDLTGTTNPENGAVTYTYDGAHRMLSRTDAKGQQTQYSYDIYGRREHVRHYLPGLVEQANQHVQYIYDTNTLVSGFSQNTAGRVAAVTFANPSPNAPEQFAYMYSYTQTGHVSTQRLRLNNGGTPVDMDATYEWDNEGKMIGSVPPGGGAGGGTPMKYLYFHDAMGRVSSMKETSCLTQTVILNACGGNTGAQVATASYGVAGEMTGLTYDGYSETRTYNSLLQLTHMTTTAAGQTVMDMQYTFSATQNNGRITQSTDGTITGGETVVYTYDTLNRLTKAETMSTAWGNAYTYDGFGNLTKKEVTPGKLAGPSLNVTYDAATNRQTGQQYDANGNPGYNGAFPYDVENRLMGSVTGGWAQWGYDPAGKRVFAKTPRLNGATPTTCEIYFYGITGQKLVTYSCGYADQDGGNGAFTYSVATRNVYFKGKLMRSGVLTLVTDRLGSVRANSNGERMNYFPYGEERTSTADGRDKFGTYFRDAGGMDYADQRYYANASGRFLTPDPSSGSGAATPGGWNRYAYVEGDPINFKDRRGLSKQFAEECDIEGECTEYLIEYLYYGEGPPQDIPAPGGGPPTRPVPKDTWFNPNDSEDWETAFKKALEDLADPSCSKHFNTSGKGISAADALRNLASAQDNNAKLFFSTTSDFVGAYANWQGDRGAAEAQYYYYGVMSTRGDIRINPDIWEGGSLNTKVLKLIHELGHLFNMVQGLGGSDIVYDANPDGSPNYKAADHNNELIRNDCLNH